jgi:exosome complex RNA-binding protein Csl4
VERVALIELCPLRTSGDDEFDSWMKAVHAKATAVIRLVIKKNTGLSIKSIKEDVQALKDGKEVMGEVDLLSVTLTQLDVMSSRVKPPVHVDILRRSGWSQK